MFKHLKLLFVVIIAASFSLLPVAPTFADEDDLPSLGLIQVPHVCGTTHDIEVLLEREDKHAERNVAVTEVKPQGAPASKVYLSIWLNPKGELTLVANMVPGKKSCILYEGNMTKDWAKNVFPDLQVEPGQGAPLPKEREAKKHHGKTAFEPTTTTDEPEIGPDHDGTWY